MSKPRLRNVEVLPAPDDKGIYIRDPLGYCAHPIGLSAGAIHVLRCLDGEHSVREIQFEIARSTGAVVHSEQIEKLIAALDEHHLLEGEGFEAHRAGVEREFRESAVRTAAFAGQSYPDDAAELRAWLSSFFTEKNGPGSMPTAQRGADELASAASATAATGAANAVSAAPANVSPAHDPVRAIVAPHIDLRRGGPCYAHAYKELVERCTARTFVILGVAHAGAENLFAATRKDFVTPFGGISTDRELLDEIAARLPFDITADEIAHRSEHSIEFQALFLQHLLGNSIAIVPILVGGFHEMLAAGQRPEDDARVAAFIDALRRALDRRGNDAAVIASVDLAHVGPRFGDSDALGPAFLAHVENEDRVFLDAASARDADRLLQEITKNGDARRVDAFPALYTLLRAIPFREGRLLRYEQAIDEQAQSTVTFASLAFS
jgi:AmmeMemoRadiSam system protein B